MQPLDLPEGTKLIDRERSDLWRVGLVYREAPAFGAGTLLDVRHRITVRPGETGLEAYERETGDVPYKLHILESED